MNGVDFSDIAGAAEACAGNWKNFGSFCWSRSYDIDDPDEWTIFYTCGRDSGILDRCNAEAIEKIMDEHVESGDAYPEHHRHFAHGWIDGYSVRVRRNGNVTKAFIDLCGIMERLQDYPVLDEEEYSRMEYEETINNLKLWYDLNEETAHEVYDWLWDNMDYELENRDGQGGMPSYDSVSQALRALGLEDDED